MKPRISNIITSVTFCLLVAVLTVASMVNPVKQYSETENRSLAQMPEFSWESLFHNSVIMKNPTDTEKSYTQKYEDFVTDQFVARDAWITLKTQAELLLGKKDSGGVYFGKDGYLIEKHELDSAQLEKNIGFLETFLKTNSANYNIKVLIAPTASLVLSDKLPAFAPVWDQNAMLDRIAELGNFVDCRDVLMEHSDEYVYYRTDHHWTTLGAYYAYTELCTSLGIEPYAYEDFNKRVLSDSFLGTLAAKVNTDSTPDELFTLEPEGVTVSVNYNNGLKITDTLYEESYLAKRDKYSAFLDGNQPIVDITTSTKNGKTLLLVKDSYSHCVVPMLTAHYERIMLIDFRSAPRGIMYYAQMLEMQGESVDDIVVFYNAENFTKDRYIFKLIMK